MQGKTVLITGAAGGIGLAVCEAFAAKGCNIAAAVWPADTAAAAVERLGHLNERLLVVEADVTSVESVEAMLDSVLQRFSSLDVLVNNAGITRDALLLRMKPEDWDLVINVNLKGAFLCTKTCARAMVRQKRGAIVNLASVVGIVGNVGQANYSASKAGMIALTKTAAKELAPFGIRVNAVAPGLVLPPEGGSEEAFRKMAASIPLRKTGGPLDVLRAVEFLLKEDFITGQIIYADGGEHLE